MRSSAHIAGPPSAGRKTTGDLIQTSTQPHSIVTSLFSPIR
jgi:hypothetical protein